MKKDEKPLVSIAELDALIGGWGSTAGQSVDKFYPLRFWYLLAIACGYAASLLFAPEFMAKTLSKEPVEIIRLSKFLYFRGWFLVVMIALGVYAYYKNWYLGIVFSIMLLLGGVNFVFDLFNVYAERLAQPTPRFTLMLLLRVAALWCVYMSIKNVSRIPAFEDRFNLLLPFKRTSSDL